MEQARAASRENQYQYQFNHGHGVSVGAPVSAYNTQVVREGGAISRQDLGTKMQPVPFQPRAQPGTAPPPLQQGSAQFGGLATMPVRDTATATRAVQPLPA